MSAWKLRPEWAHLDVFDRLLQNEFMDPAERDKHTLATLKVVLAHAQSTVPYYSERFAQHGFSPSSVGQLSDLLQLPVLSKRQVQNNTDRLHAVRLIAGHQVTGFTKTSGSTGEPVTVSQTDYNSNMFGFLKQREFRWHRYDQTKNWP